MRPEPLRGHPHHAEGEAIEAVVEAYGVEPSRVEAEDLGAAVVGCGVHRCVRGDEAACCRVAGAELFGAHAALVGELQRRGLDPLLGDLAVARELPHPLDEAGSQVFDPLHGDAGGECPDELVAGSQAALVGEVHDVLESVAEGHWEVSGGCALQGVVELLPLLPGVRAGVGGQEGEHEGLGDLGGFVPVHDLAIKHLFDRRGVDSFAEGGGFAGGHEVAAAFYDFGEDAEEPAVCRGGDAEVVGEAVPEGPLEDGRLLVGSDCVVVDVGAIDLEGRVEEEFVCEALVLGGLQGGLGFGQRGGLGLAGGLFQGDGLVVLGVDGEAQAPELCVDGLESLGSPHLQEPRPQHSLLPPVLLLGSGVLRGPLGAEGIGVVDGDDGAPYAHPDLHVVRGAHRTKACGVVQKDGSRTSETILRRSSTRVSAESLSLLSGAPMYSKTSSGNRWIRKEARKCLRMSFLSVDSSSTLGMPQASLPLATRYGRRVAMGIAAARMVFEGGVGPTEDPRFGEALDHCPEALHRDMPPHETGDPPGGVRGGGEPGRWVAARAAHVVEAALVVCKGVGLEVERALEVEGLVVVEHDVSAVLVEVVGVPGAVDCLAVVDDAIVFGDEGGSLADAAVVPLGEGEVAGQGLAKGQDVGFGAAAE
eukprot:768817-Hanusia_phi.AAC.6